MPRRAAAGLAVALSVCCVLGPEGLLLVLKLLLLRWRLLRARA